MDLARKVEELLHGKIPITRALGVTVEEYDGRRLVLAAPLGENVNHLGTAFGGSLNTLAVLSCYVLLWLELREEGATLSSATAPSTTTGPCVKTSERSVPALTVRR